MGWELRLAALAGLAVLGGCPSDGDVEPLPFPPDFETAWQEGRPACRLSHDHELRYVRMFANELAIGPYTRFDAVYPPGATILKVEYRDEACAERLSHVVMRKTEAGSAPDEGDWEWLRFDAALAPVRDPYRIPLSCVTCHRYHCGEPPYGFDLTCADGLAPH